MGKQRLGLIQLMGYIKILMRLLIILVKLLLIKMLPGLVVLLLCRMIFKLSVWPLVLIFLICSGIWMSILNNSIYKKRP